MMVGTIAACLTTFSFLPQVVKVVKTKETKSISFLMYLMSSIGIFLWTFHGYIIKDSALFYANAITFCMALIILIYKIKYR